MTLCTLSTIISFGNEKLADCKMFDEDAPISTLYLPASAIQDDVFASNVARSSALSVNVIACDWPALIELFWQRPLILLTACPLFIRCSQV